MGIAGSAFAALCCLGISAALSVVSAIGLGFLINDAILLPLLFVSIGVTLWGLYSGWRRHRRTPALLAGSIGAAALVVFTFAYRSRALTLMSIALLVVASVMNVLFLRHRDHAVQSKGERSI